MVVQEFETLEEVRAHGVGAFMLDQDGNMVLHLPCGIVRLNVTDKRARPFWKLTRDAGKVSIGGLRITLPSFKWLGAHVPEQELWSGSLVEGRLTAA